MAFVSSTSLSFKSSLQLPNNTNQASCIYSNLSTVTLGWTNRRKFPSLRTSGFRISCAAHHEITQKVYEIVRKRLALAESELTPQTKFSALGADSLDTVEIVMSFEEEFGITVEEENSELITTVQEAAELINKIIQKKGGD